MESEQDREAYLNAPVGIVLAEDRVIRACNPAFAAMFGYLRPALIGRSLALLYPSREEFVRTGEIGLGPLRRTGAYGDERIMARADSTLFWCRVNGRTLSGRDDPLARAVWTFHDLSDTRRAENLSMRDRQVVMHLATGLTSKEIARLLGLSPRTVEAYRARLLKKFGAANVAGLLARMSAMPVPERGPNEPAA